MTDERQNNPVSGKRRDISDSAWRRHRRLLIGAPLVIGAAAAEFWALRAPRSLHLPPQQQVVTINPKIGIHTRLTGIGDEGYIRRTLEQVREMGARWIVDLFPWAYVQPRSRFGYDWAGTDMVVRHAVRQGLQVIARLDIVPPWARPRNSSDRYLDEAHYADFAGYAAAFLQRYRADGVRHIVVWNEPNLAFEWGRRPPDPAGYAALLKAVYPRVKAAVPDAVVIAGALSPGGDLGDQAEVRMGDLRYITELYAAGAAPWFDAWAVHNYGAQQPHDAPPAPEEVNFRRVELIRDLLTYLGDRHKPIFITEGGWNDHPRWSAAVRPAQRVRWTIGAYQMALEWTWLEAMCLWQFSTPWQARTYQDNWNFVAADGTPKAIYWAVRDYAVPPDLRR
jgi:hypothetical protein